jgi:hypothetical protein
MITAMTNSATPIHTHVASSMPASPFTSTSRSNGEVPHRHRGDDKRAHDDENGAPELVLSLSAHTTPITRIARYTMNAPHATTINVASACKIRMIKFYQD